MNVFKPILTSDKLNEIFSRCVISNIQPNLWVYEVGEEDTKILFTLWKEQLVLCLSDYNSTQTFLSKMKFYEYFRKVVGL